MKEVLSLQNNSCLLGNAIVFYVSGMCLYVLSYSIVIEILYGRYYLHRTDTFY